MIGMAKIGFFRTITVILLCAVFALLYAHQEIEIVKTSFSINEHRQELSFLLDQHRTLVYNLSRLELPERIEDTLCTNEIALSMPKIGNVRRFDGMVAAYGGEKPQPQTGKSVLASIFDRFTVKAEAEVVK